MKSDAMATFVNAAVITIRIFAECCGFTRRKMDRDLYTASAECDTQFLCDRIHESPTAVLQRTRIRDTLLHISAGVGDLTTVKAIIHLHSQSPLCIRMWPLLRLKNCSGNTALHEAAYEGNTEVAQHLLELDPSLALVHNKRGETPLFMASEKGHLPVVEAILSCKFPSNRLARSRNDGQNCFHVAAYRGHLVVLIRLVEHCKSMLKHLDKADERGATALHYAVDGGQNEVVQYLARCRPKLCDKFDKFGRYPIHIAATKGNIHALAAIAWERPDCILMPCKRGKNILHYATENEHQSLLLWLSEQRHYRLRGDEIDKKGNQPLHLAAKLCADDSTLRALMEGFARVQPNATNRDGFTPLDMVYCSSKSRECKRRVKKCLESVGAFGDYSDTQEGEEPETKSQRNSRIMDINALVAALIASVSASGPVQLASSSSSSSSDSDDYFKRLYFKIYLASNMVAFMSAVTVLLVWLLLEVSWNKADRPWLKTSMTVLAVSLVAEGIAVCGASHMASPAFETFLYASVVVVVTLVWIMLGMWLWCSRAKYHRKAQLKRLLRRASCQLLAGFVLVGIGAIVIYLSSLRSWSGW